METQVLWYCGWGMGCRGFHSLGFSTHNLMSTCFSTLTIYFCWLCAQGAIEARIALLKELAIMRTVNESILQRMAINCQDESFPAGGRMGN